MSEVKNNQNVNEEGNLTEEGLTEQRQIRRQKLKDLQEAGRNPFLIEKWDINAYSQSVKDNFDEMDGSEVSMAGRIMAKRVMGKASFIDIQDSEGRIQCHVKRDLLGLKHLDRVQGIGKHYIRLVRKAVHQINIQLPDTGTMNDLGHFFHMIQCLGQTPHFTQQSVIENLDTGAHARNFIFRNTSYFSFIDRRKAEFDAGFKGLAYIIFLPDFGYIVKETIQYRQIK